MDDALLERLHALLGRIEHLVAGWETRHASPAEPDWSAHAFRWRRGRGLVAVTHPNTPALDGLRGIEQQKARLVRNTRQFVRGLPANNVLLWGARGTGKSSLVRGLLNTFTDDGLRLVEVEAQDLADLPDIVAPLFGRPERFILFSDDLSFEADDASYKALKAILDGSVEATPDNVLVYATSNRRHLLPEYLDENREAHNVDGEIHHGDTVEEKLSLSERFGLWLSFYPFDQDAYLEIVRTHLAAMDMTADDPEAMQRAALQWALARGVRSGRAALQFARDWSGRHSL